MTKSIFSTIGIHTTLWLFLLALPVFTTAPFIFYQQAEVPQRFYIMFAYSSILLLFIFYTNYLLLFPHFYLNSKKLIYYLLTLLTMLIVVILTRILIVNFNIISEPYVKSKSIIIAFAIFRILLAFFLSGALVIYERWQKSERERLFAEVSFLKAQINPHFLFNTLNGIYTLVLKKSDRAADSVSKLSAIMRYVVTEATNEKVALEDEINYITNYLDLQKLRLTNTTQINYTVTGNPDGLQIEPLLLISFIENAFKYGVSTEHAGTIVISITIESGQIQLVVNNNKVNKSLLHNSVDGIGLDNTKKRLGQNYNNKHQLNIQNNEKEYSVNLILQLR